MCFYIPLAARYDMLAIELSEVARMNGSPDSSINKLREISKRLADEEGEDK